jgi:hypothetical protein
MGRLTSPAPSLIIRFLAYRPVSAEDWTQFRGPARDGRSLETGLLIRWPAGGPKLLWTANGLDSQIRRIRR